MVDYLAADATSLAASVAVGDVTATELLALVTQRCAVVNPALNATPVAASSLSARILATMREIRWIAREDVSAGPGRHRCARLDPGLA
jgi:hypothetical protein